MHSTARIVRHHTSPPGAADGGPPTKPDLSVTEIAQLATIVDWLREYVAKPHPEIGRTGPVCPFVPVSLRTGALRVVVHTEFDGSDPAALTALLRSYLTEFLATAPESTAQRRQRSVVIVLPSVPEERQLVLNDVHAAFKDEVVRAGAMLGQFYERCPERAVRNPEFLVSTGPVPCFAIRHMAPHDVLFLHDQPDWFALYHRRFADEFRGGKVSDPLMVRLFQAAESAMTGADRQPPDPPQPDHPGPPDDTERKQP